MLDYKKQIEVIEKKLADCWAMPYSEENYKKISGYWKDLFHLKHLVCNGEVLSMPTEEQINYSMSDMSNKSEFEKTVIEIYKRKPDKETLLRLLREFDSVAMILKTMHPARYNEFLNRLKGVNY